MKQLIKSFVAIIALMIAQHTGLHSATHKLSKLNLSNNAIEQLSEIEAPYRSIEYGNNEVRVYYDLKEACLQNTSVDNQEYNLEFKGFINSPGTGGPRIPMRSDIFYAPEEYGIFIDTEDCEFKDYHMALSESLPELTGDGKVLDKVSQSMPSSGFYPSSPVINNDNNAYYGDMHIIKVKVCPVLYDQQRNIVRIYSKISYRISYDPSDSKVSSTSREYTSDYTGLKTLHAAGIVPLDSNLLMPGQYEDSESGLTLPMNLSDSSGLEHNGISRRASTYLIITKPQLISAANKLAEWKRCQGFKVEVLSKSVWNIDVLSNMIKVKYSSSSKPVYCLLFGDHSLIPTFERFAVINGEIDEYTTDLPYFLINGDDNYPEIKFGRLPASTLDEANTMVSKVIGYEKCPPASASFYSTGINLAYFQDMMNEDDLWDKSLKNENSNGYEDMRHCETSQDIYQYLTANRKMNIKRFFNYDGEQSLGPKYWSKLFSYGKPIPSSVPILYGYNIVYTDDDLEKALNDGALYILYTGHGGANEWPYGFASSYTFKSMKNGSLLPFIFSITCNTGYDSGKQMLKESLINKNGGAIGYVASSSVSFSSANYALVHGIFNAFWPSPGLISDFRYTDDPRDGDVEAICNKFIPTTQPAVLEIFDAVQQGFFRSEQIYPVSDYFNNQQRERYCLYADPSLKLYTQNAHNNSANTQFKVQRTKDTVIVESTNSNGVITIYDTDSKSINSFNGASYVVYKTQYPEKVAVSKSCDNSPTNVNLGASVTFNFEL